jgi:hypothetical protein
MPTIKISSPSNITNRKLALVKRVSYQSDGEAEPHFDDIDCRKLIQNSNAITTRQWKPTHKIHPEQKPTLKICDNFNNENHSSPSAQRQQNPIKLIGKKNRDNGQNHVNKSSQIYVIPPAVHRQFEENPPIFTVQSTTMANGTQSLTVENTGMRATISEESLSECSLSESMSCDCKLKSITIQLAKS